MSLIEIVGILLAGGALFYAKKSVDLQLYPSGGIKRFEKYLGDYKSWKELYNENDAGDKVWRYDKNNSYELRIRRIDHFSAKESWMFGFADENNNSLYEVDLLTNGKIVNSEKYNFISLDGGRWFVPLPKVGSNNEYYLLRHSVNLKIDAVIGDYLGNHGKSPSTIYPKNIKEFSERQNIFLT